MNKFEQMEEGFSRVMNLIKDYDDKVKAIIETYLKVNRKTNNPTEGVNHDSHESKRKGFTDANLQSNKNINQDNLRSTH